MNIPNPILEAALDYAQKGWRVIPLHSIKANGKCSCGNDNCKSLGKHPRISEWEKAATKNTKAIENWFSNWPESNIGIVGGPDSGIAVLDVDPRHGGDESLRALETKYGSLPQTPSVVTGGNGLHFYFRYPKAAIGNKAGFREGLDFKADRGYVVAPPSKHASGKNYEWKESEAEPAELPEWLAKELAGQRIPSEKLPAKPGEIAEGSRNSHLFKVACSLRRTGLDAEELAIALKKHNQTHCNPPLEESEVEQIAASAGSYPLQSESDIKQTDLGNAKWLVKEFGADILYCPHWSRWLVWDGKRYQVDECLEIERIAKRTTKKMREVAEAIEDQRQRQDLIIHSIRSESLGRIRAMVELAKSEQGITIKPDQLDQDPWLFNCANGMIDLKTGELLAHDRSRLQSKASPVEYDPNAACPQWISFLERIMAGKKDLIDCLQQAAGYALTASTREQCMFFLYGVGANGKSTFLNTLAEMLGDYASTTPTSTLMVKKNEGIPNDIARLKGLRFVMAAETEMGKALAESLVKQMTGGDELVGRFLHGEFFKFTPQFKLFLATNHKPDIRGTDDGIWRRIRLIPFEVTIPEAERDKDLPEKLKAEFPGILRWAVQGCLKWQAEGLRAPQAVSEATNEYRNEMDSLASFLDQKCRTGSGLKVGATELYRLYSNWCNASNERPLRQNQFGQKIKERGFESRRSGANGNSEWHGIGPNEISDGFEINAHVTGL